MIPLNICIILLSSVVTLCKTETVIYEKPEKYCEGNNYTHIYNYYQQTHSFKLRWCDAKHCCVHECGFYSPEALHVSVINSELIPPNGFANSGNLIRIGGVQQGITTLASRSFVNLQNLIQIDLAFNKIRYIQHDVFVNVSAKFVDLSWNRIVSIEQNAFGGLENLEYLQLDHNELSYIYAFPKGSVLERLELSHNYLKRLVVSMERYPNLTVLDASFNNLTNVAITGRYIKRVDLSNNQLEKLDVFNVNRVNVLNIEYNKFADFQVSMCRHIKMLALFPNPWNSSKIEEILARCSVVDKQSLLYNKSNDSSLFCTDDSTCSDNEICRTNRCSDPCDYNICEAAGSCTTTNHIFTCNCPGNFKKNLVEFNALCYDVECFVDEDCPDKMPCKQATRTCDTTGTIRYVNASVVVNRSWYYDELDPVLDETVAEENKKM